MAFDIIVNNANFERVKAGEAKIIYAADVTSRDLNRVLGLLLRLRADVDPEDVGRILNGCWFLPDGPEWRGTVGRMLGLIIDGLRYGTPARSERPESR